MEFNVNRDSLSLFAALASDTRIKMVEMLSREPLNIKEMAQKLGISSAIVTKHVQQLKEAGIIDTEISSGKRGMQKKCFLVLDRLTLVFKPSGSTDEIIHPDQNGYSVSIPVGHYVSYQVKPTCGLASEAKLIGMRDDPRYFAEPEHVHAQHLWFASGYVEYQIPNYMVESKLLTDIRISLEICSEAPGYDENWPSDILFSVGGVEVCKWTSPGDFGSVRGKLTPLWWDQGSTQHGLLKTLWINADGTFMDGVRLSRVTIQDIPIAPAKPIRFRISSPEDAKYPGGVSLFGRNFGNYEQDIEVQIRY
ncbi:helix-turn-helix domain-containing protein [Paenibacillus sp. FSL M7-1455]|jgi:predicted transcriptional regulator|uniref:Transcriptional regulator n=1 Tax=Paenibacillus cookii TaxID=157839 RepID=A0ABQ4M0M3_9BACL|nr:helix-turn-helix domain-containing protein [Paenibacillus cookii]GIO69072.1 transcriptional regulator [Paenibacillus cookii]HWO54151.1 helix-turn-helix domain-containing protein [Paenibacillus cookii]